MEALRSYILSVTAAAVLCAIVSTLVGNKGMIAAVMKLLTGVIMACVVVQPLGSAVTAELKDYMQNLDIQTSAAVTAGSAAAEEVLSERIIQQTQAYILDKAAELDAELTVDVILKPGDIPVPSGVIISGNVSPYAKKELQDMIAGDLGISKEAQTWT